MTLGEFICKTLQTYGAMAVVLTICAAIAYAQYRIEGSKWYKGWRARRHGVTTADVIRDICVERRDDERGKVAFMYDGKEESS